MLERTPQREARFWAKVKRSAPEECWEWTACLSTTGYGRFGTTRNGKSAVFYAHRVCFEWYHGSAEGLFVRHKCDNPKCVNPRHLEGGSHLDNMQDMVDRNRHVGYRKMTPEDSQIIREMRAGGVSPKEIATAFDVCVQHIRAICRGRFWKTGGPITQRRRITREEVEGIKKQLSQGVERAKIAQNFGFSKSLVSQVAIGLKDHLLCH